MASHVHYFSCCCQAHDNDLPVTHGGDGEPGHADSDFDEQRAAASLNLNAAGEAAGGKGTGGRRGSVKTTPLSGSSQVSRRVGYGGRRGQRTVERERPKFRLLPVYHVHPRAAFRCRI